jgi:hypothetical protein
MVSIPMLWLAVCTIIHTCNAIISVPLWNIGFKHSRISVSSIRYLLEMGHPDSPVVSFNQDRDTNPQMVLLLPPELETLVPTFVGLIPMRVVVMATYLVYMT